MNYVTHNQRKNMFTENTNYPSNALPTAVPDQVASIQDLVSHLNDELSKLAEINDIIYSRICPVMKYPVTRTPTNISQGDCPEMSHLASKIYDLITKVRKESDFITAVVHTIEL